jgi:type IV pilus biogenesis protein CpaD/CtpE
MVDIVAGHFWPIGGEMRAFQILVMAAVLAGCASGPPRVTGQVRPAIEDYTTITILTEIPEGAEEIAIVEVKASSKAGLSQQQKIDYAVEELRQQAAKVGANTVVIGSTSTELDMISTGDGKWTYNKTGVVHGVAVWVD